MGISRHDEAIGKWRSSWIPLVSIWLLGSLWIPLVSIWLLGCEPAREPSRQTVSLRLRGGPPGATVIVDDEPLGSLEFVAAHGVAVPAGLHHVTVIAVGYFPWDREIDAHPGSAPIALEVALTPIPE